MTSTLTKGWTLYLAVISLLCMLMACGDQEIEQRSFDDPVGQRSHRAELDSLVAARKSGDKETLDPIRKLAERTKEENDGSTQVLALLEWGLIHELAGALDSADVLYQKAKLESLLHSDTLGLGHSYYHMANRYRFQGVHDEAMLYFDSAKTIYETLGSKVDMAKAIFGKGVIRDYMGEFKASTDHFFEALALAEEAGDSTLIAKCYNSLGILFTRSYQWDESIAHYRKSLILMEDMGDAQGQGNALDNIGDAFRLKEEYDSARVYANEALALRRSIGDRRGVGRGLSNLGLIHLKMQALDSAEAEFAEAISIFEAIDDKHSLVSCLNRQATLFQLRSDYEAADQAAQRALNISQGLGSQNEEMHIHRNLAEIHEHFGKYRTALEHFKAYHHLKDTLLTERNSKNLNELETKYQSERKDKQIAEQERNLAIEQSKVRKKNNWIIFISALAVVVALIFWTRHRSYVQNRKLEQAKIKQLESERKIGFAEAMISGQEIERSRIAKDLHDGLGAILATAKMHLDQVQEGIKQLEQLKVSEKAGELLDTAYSEVRRISHDMMPASLEKFGLEEALSSLCSQVSSASLQSHLDSDLGAQRLDTDLEFALFRIAQEATNNILKYAEATEMRINLRKSGHRIGMEIIDNGKGFEKSDTARPGLGLKNMESRAGFFGGSVQVTSSPGKGCHIQVTIPLHHEG